MEDTARCYGHVMSPVAGSTPGMTVEAAKLSAFEQAVITSHTGRKAHPLGIDAAAVQHHSTC